MEAIDAQTELALKDDLLRQYQRNLTELLNKCEGYEAQIRTLKNRGSKDARVLLIIGSESRIKAIIGVRTLEPKWSMRTARKFVDKFWKV